MPLIKLATAARRARMGSITAVSRALRAAGVPLVMLEPGVFAVEETHLQRFLHEREVGLLPPPPPKPKSPDRPHLPLDPKGKPKKPGRRQ